MKGRDFFRPFLFLARNDTLLFYSHSRFAPAVVVFAKWIYS